MKKVMLFLDDETGKKLTEYAKKNFRSVKATAEKIVTDEVHKEKNK